jgi:hypothetical protein
VVNDALFIAAILAVTLLLARCISEDPNHPYDD